MKRSIRTVLLVLAGAVLLFAGAAPAQQYPSRPVRLVVGFAAGSGPDIVARAVGAQLSSDLGQNFFVENRLGANGTIAAKAVVDAAPDGYTLLYTSSGFATTPYMYKKAVFDVLRATLRRSRPRASSTATCWWPILRRRSRPSPI